jgi:pimeloyl-ACP methyl ester carboxylesterase
VQGRRGRYLLLFCAAMAAAFALGAFRNTMADAESVHYSLNFPASGTAAGGEGAMGKSGRVVVDLANTLPADQQEAIYERYIVPESRRVPRESLTSVGRVDFAKEHVPLLLVAGGADHIIPASLNRANARRYRAPGSVTDFRLWEGRDHVTILEPGWRDVAAYVLEWLDGLAPASK